MTTKDYYISTMRDGKSWDTKIVPVEELTGGYWPPTREVLARAIEGGVITKPGHYAVAAPDSRTLCLCLYEVEEVPQPRLRIKDAS